MNLNAKHTFQDMQAYRLEMDALSRTSNDIAANRAMATQGIMHRQSLADIVQSIVAKETILAKWTSLGFTPTKVMEEEIATLTRKAKALYREELEARLAAANRKAEELKSKERQREEAEAEIAKLAAELEGR